MKLETSLVEPPKAYLNIDNQQVLQRSKSMRNISTIFVANKNKMAKIALNKITN
jgi:hypothetical protein